MGGQSRRALCARSKQKSRWIFIQIVHRPADIGERAATIRHQHARAFVKVVGELMYGLDGLNKLTAILPRSESLQPLHDTIGARHQTASLSHRALGLEHDVVHPLGVARQRRRKCFNVFQ